jgi:hypothetical protein
MEDIIFDCTGCEFESKEKSVYHCINEPNQHHQPHPQREDQTDSDREGYVLK